MGFVIVENSLAIMQLLCILKYVAMLQINKYEKNNKNKKD